MGTKPSKESRKSLIEEYKRTPRDMGVYRIRNTVNGKSFVASSKDVRARFNRHKMDLKNNSERIRGLQEDWNAFGAEAFEFEVVDLLKPPEDDRYDPTEDLEVLEKLWLDKLEPFGDNGYNAR